MTIETGRTNELAEKTRLAESEARTANWKRWGPYLSERQWGTVREDYSADGNPWTYFPHDHARSRAYRWGEDGLLGITDRECRLCFALALWNGNDPILKERLFGLTGPEGNHGEDVKECYYYLDSTPSHSWMKALYKYPQQAFPYDALVAENRRRGKGDPEFELTDTSVFDENRYFDVTAEYAKAGPDDILIRISVTNRGPEAATIHLLPTIWFRNVWSWDCDHEGCGIKPQLRRDGSHRIAASHETLGEFRLELDPASFGDAPEIAFTENETNFHRLGLGQNATPFVKDSFHTWVIGGDVSAINANDVGTKAAVQHVRQIEPGETSLVQLRLFSQEHGPRESFGASFEQTLEQRLQEADDFYTDVISVDGDTDKQNISRQAFAGLLWSKQFYHYALQEWIDGDPSQPPPPSSRMNGRNHDWRHLFNRDVISMPDKWEYPWYAAWDLAFHMIPFAEIDPDFAKSQLILFLREWYMHPSGQIPAYEFAFSDVNPPVHAWACWRVYKISGEPGQRDRDFLERVFHKLLLNFTWWVNRKDVHGQHIFSGGFLGLDNIGVFDRSKPLPRGGQLQQADGTAWMAFFCGTMLSIALELARENSAYEDVASKFFEHYIAIADAINYLGGTGLWDEDDGFFYDQIHTDGQSILLKTRSLVGLVPLFAADVLEENLIDSLPHFRKRMNWFLEHRPDLARLMTCDRTTAIDGDVHSHRLLALPSRERLERMLGYLLDEQEFLSPYGIRSLSKVYEAKPFAFDCGGDELRVQYDPAESTTGLFGGNSNWRGPIWLPMNYLIIEALQRYDHFYGDKLRVAFPTGSDNLLTLKEVADRLSARLSGLFLADDKGRRPCHGNESRYADEPHWRDLILFYEYFHGDNGRGCGASHQTGWTALIVRCLQDGLYAPIRQTS